MPSEFAFSYPDKSKLIAAWQAHYEAKGCHPVKARWVALRKVWRSSNWPPVTA